MKRLEILIMSFNTCYHSFHQQKIRTRRCGRNQKRHQLKIERRLASKQFLLQSAMLQTRPHMVNNSLSLYKRYMIATLVLHNCTDDSYWNLKIFGKEERTPIISHDDVQHHTSFQATLLITDFLIMLDDKFPATVVSLLSK